MINKISKFSYKVGRKSRDLKAIQKAWDKKSLMPIIKRIFNKWVGRNIVSKLWWK